MKYIVYLTTNIKNNKIYVGVHGTEDPEIFDGYLGNSINRFKCNPELKYPKIPFHKAVKKYGYDAFKRSTIKVFDTLEEALDLEAEIVNEEFIKRADTYNITLGGGLPPLLNKIIYQYDLEGNFIKKWNSITEASKYYNTSACSIGRAIAFNRTSANYLWSDKKFDKLDIQNYHIYIPKIPVHLYLSTGEWYKTYESMSDCVRDLDDDISHVQRAIKLGVMVKGYYISDLLYDMYTKSSHKRFSGEVHQYDLEGNYIQSYTSIKEIEQKYGETFKGINESIRMGRQYKGYLWYRGNCKPESLTPVKTKVVKKIAQCDMEGNIIKIFDSLRKCRKEFPNVSKVLNGTASHCHNFKFKYVE